MTLELLLQCGLLLTAVVIAFAISSVVGMLVASLSTTPTAHDGGLNEPHPRPSRPDPARGA